MKEQLYTIPMMDALRANDECPFCFIERSLEQHALDFVIGPEATYMQDDVRAETDRMGFCREHLQKMFTYGNPLASALILDTHWQAKLKELKKELKNYSGASKVGIVKRLRGGEMSFGGPVVPADLSGQGWWRGYSGLRGRQPQSQRPAG